MLDDAESVETGSFPGCLDLANENAAHKCEPGVLQLDWDRPQDSSAVIKCDLRRSIGNEINKFENFADVAVEGCEAYSVWPSGPCDRRDVL
jgi:hypothetical protein